MNIRRGEVHEVVSFYSFLQVPVDVVRVCTGPVCDCAGSRELLHRRRARGRRASATATSRRSCCDGDDVVGGVTHSTNGFLLEPDELREPPELCARTRCSRGSRRRA